MKKILLTLFCIVGSYFFVYAEMPAGSGGVNVTVGKVCGTIQGKPACINPSTGQWEISNGQGGGVQFNTNTGQVGVAGTLGGVGINVGVAGTQGAGAAGNGNSANYSGILGLLALAQAIVIRLVPLLVGIALLAFFVFLIEFIWKGNISIDEQKKAKAGMFWSIAALFVMVSIWGIIGFFGSALGINQGGTITGFKLPGEQ